MKSVKINELVKDDEFHRPALGIERDNEILFEDDNIWVKCVNLQHAICKAVSKFYRDSYSIEEMNLEKAGNYLSFCSEDVPFPIYCFDHVNDVSYPKHICVKEIQKFLHQVRLGFVKKLQKEMKGDLTDEKVLSEYFGQKFKICKNIDEIDSSCFNIVIKEIDDDTYCLSNKSLEFLFR